ncbi:MAG TPA: hypothetical protein DCP91_06465 [Eggerthellaceae bacterium]|nr:hypothetical protein [Eggerthellaceae bacterium]
MEFAGTYPLPEAQLDRFLIKLSMGYPTLDQEVQVVHNVKAAKARIGAVVGARDILDLRAAAEEVIVSDPVARYAVQVVTATRTMKECRFGSSPRGSLALVSLARANALMRGRIYVMPDDIKYLAPYVLAHRIDLTHEAKVNGRTNEAVIQTILDSVAVPQVSDDVIQRGLDNR